MSAEKSSLACLWSCFTFSWKCLRESSMPWRICSWGSDTQGGVSETRVASSFLLQVLRYLVPILSWNLPCFTQKTHTHTHTHTLVCIHILHPLCLSDIFFWPQGWENSGLRKLEGSERKLRQSCKGQHFVTWCYVVSCHSGTRSCLTLCHPMDCNTPGFPVFHPHGFYIHWNRVGNSIAVYAHGVCVLSKPSSLKRRQTRIRGLAGDALGAVTWIACPSRIMGPCLLAPG